MGRRGHDGPGVFHGLSGFAPVVPEQRSLQDETRRWPGVLLPAVAESGATDAFPAISGSFLRHGPPRTGGDHQDLDVARHLARISRCAKLLAVAVLAKMPGNALPLAPVLVLQLPAGKVVSAMASQRTSKR